MVQVNSNQSDLVSNLFFPFCVRGGLLLTLLLIFGLLLLDLLFIVCYVTLQRSILVLQLCYSGSLTRLVTLSNESLLHAVSN